MPKNKKVIQEVRLPNFVSEFLYLWYHLYIIPYWFCYFSLYMCFFKFVCLAIDLVISRNSYFLKPTVSCSLYCKLVHWFYLLCRFHGKLNPTNYERFTTPRTIRSLELEWKGNHKKRKPIGWIKQIWSDFVYPHIVLIIWQLSVQYYSPIKIRTKFCDFKKSNFVNTNTVMFLSSACCLQS